MQSNVQRARNDHDERAHKGAHAMRRFRILGSALEQAMLVEEARVRIRQLSKEQSESRVASSHEGHGSQIVQQRRGGRRSVGGQHGEDHRGISRAGEHVRKGGLAGNACAVRRAACAYENLPRWRWEEESRPINSAHRASYTHRFRQSSSTTRNPIQSHGTCTCSYDTLVAHGSHIIGHHRDGKGVEWRTSHFGRQVWQAADWMCFCGSRRQTQAIQVKTRAQQVIPT